MGLDNNFSKVDYPNNERKGATTHVSYLFNNANVQTTAVTKRGLVFMEKILCINPGNPSGEAIDVDSIEESGIALVESNVRAVADFHKNQGSSCNGCHKTMDPLGIAFENFSPSGSFRVNYDDGVEVDSSGEIQGQKFNSAHDLIDIFSQSNNFDRCFVENFLHYATNGRELEKNDDNLVSYVSRKINGVSKPFSQIVEEIVTSPSFFCTVQGENSNVDQNVDQNTDQESNGVTNEQ